MRRATLLVLASLALAPVHGALAAPADAPADEARLRERLAPEVLPQVLAVVREARAAGLPGDPLVGRALEGASRHAGAAEILGEVRREAAALGGARAALGASASDNELVAAAGALIAGVPADSLGRLRAAHPARSLVIALVVLCDVAARGVPPDAAAGAVLTAVRAGASDATLMRLRERIHDRIDRGAAPGGATQSVLRQWLESSPRGGARSGGADGAAGGRGRP